MASKIQVTVTGGSGYIASHSIIKLIQAGYGVKATLRNMEREPSLRAVIEKNCNTKNYDLTCIEATLTSDKNWDEAVKGSTYVLHIASPIIFEKIKNPEEEIIRPAKEGALRVLEASLRNKVRRVVLTSSIAAISYGHEPPKDEALLDEETWTDLAGKGLNPYVISKTQAEKAAWEFIEKTGNKLELVALNPAAVLGPVFEKDFGVSPGIVKKLLDGSVPALPNAGFQIVDVRDVAQAHIEAMTRPEANGKRIILTDRFLWFKEIASVLRGAYADKGLKVPKMVIPDFMVRIFAAFDSETRAVLPDLGVRRELNNGRMKNLLAIDPISAEDSILATAESLLEHGIIRR